PHARRNRPGASAYQEPRRAPRRQVRDCQRTRSGHCRPRHLSSCRTFRRHAFAVLQVCRMSDVFRWLSRSGGAYTAALLLPLSWLPASAAEPISVALIAPLTGGTSAQGIAMRNGAALAVREINTAGGVMGRPLLLLEYDDRSVNET